METLLAYAKQLFDNESYRHDPIELYEPIHYTMHLGGKRIRPVMLMAANQLFGGNPEQVSHAAIAIETFHNFTLLHDDLMDKSPLRRGQPTVYRKWNENIAILSGDTMFAMAWRYLLKKPHHNLQMILNTFNETAIEVCEGQQYDMNFETSDVVTIPQYIEMIRQKTAVLLAGALKMGALYADAPQADIDNLYQYGIHLGLAFQLQDDLLDAYGDVATFGKQTQQDIRDRKKTFLILKALEVSNESQQTLLRQLFAQPDGSQNEEDCIRQVLEIYNELNIRQQTEAAIDEEFKRAEAFLDAVNRPESDKKPLRQLNKKLLNRQY